MADPSQQQQTQAQTQLLQALQQELEQEQHQQQEQHEQRQRGDDGTVFGFTPAALVLGLVVSTLGLALLRMARITVQWSVAVVGLALMVLPFFVTDAAALGAVSVAVVVGLLLWRRLTGGG